MVSTRNSVTNGRPVGQASDSPLPSHSLPLLSPLWIELQELTHGGQRQRRNELCFVPVQLLKSLTGQRDPSPLKP
jgi:hypothetical protein